MKIWEFEKPLMHGQPISIIDISPKMTDPKASRVFGKIAMFSFGGIGIMGLEHIDETSNEDQKESNNIRL